MKGFIFEKQSYAFIPHQATEAETIYGDSYRKDEDAVREIGNNVTLEWTDMDFGSENELTLVIKGSTPLGCNTIQVRIRNDKGETISSVAEFTGQENETQSFSVSVPSGNCTVSFVFLPGSAFDFYSFCFYLPENWTEK